MLLASAVDRLSLLWWAQTKDGQNNTNRPKMFTDILSQKEEENEVKSFNSGKDFTEYRLDLIKRKLLCQNQ